MYHGVNPSMGWLFALYLGLQRGSSKAIFNGLISIILGHTLSILAVLGLIYFLSVSLPTETFHLVISVALVIFGIYCIIRRRHFKWVGMSLNWWELSWWSFLMATSEGAGLMFVPLFFFPYSFFNFLLPLLLVFHTVSMFMIMAFLALLFYKDTSNLISLRKWWFNFELFWGVVLLLIGIVLF